MIRQSAWNTYKTTAYTGTYDDGRVDPRCTGGLYYHQIRKTKNSWETRVVIRNGSFEHPLPATPLDEMTGQRMFQMAKTR